MIVESELLNAKQILKYAKYSVPELRKKAGMRFRAWIRRRDEDKPCISCGSFNTSDASHYYSAGHYPELEFHENNVHLACKKCNTFLHGNLIEYRKGLLERIGGDKIEELDTIASFYKQQTYKHDRFNLLQIIEKYGKSS